MYFQTLVILLPIGSISGDFLLVHDDCKYWNYLKVYENVQKKKVHCILDQDFQFGLVYTEWKLIAKGKCPIYNRFAKEIDSIPCNGTIGTCPNKSFHSYSGVTFTGCYDAIRKQTNEMRPTVPPAVSDNSGILIPVLVALATLASTNCLFVIVCVWHFFRRSKIKLCRGTNQKQKLRVRIPILDPVSF